MAFNKICSFLLIVVFAGCTFNVRIVNEPEMISDETLNILSGSINQYAVISVGEDEISCKIVGANKERLVIASREVVSEIPVKAIHKVYLYGQQRGGSNIAAMMIAGVTGGFLGDLGGREFAANKDNDKEIRVGSAILGACAGMLAIRSMSKGSEKELTINSSIKSVELHASVGKSLTSQTIQSRNLFNDVPLGAGETLLKARIYKYDENQYIAVYEVHNGKDTVVKWIAFDETYFKAQKAKLEQPLKDQIFKNSSLNGQ